MMKYSSQRKSIRLEENGGVALTPIGVCQVINLSKGGLLLKCFQELEFPHEWTMDIYDEKGLNLQDLRVKKVWAKRLGDPNISSNPQVGVGVAFENLSASQEVQLYSHLLQLMAV